MSIVEKTFGGQALLMPVADLETFERPELAIEADGAHLAGSRCEGCGAVHFPQRLSCFECLSTDLSPYSLAATGTLYSWTVVRVSSSRPVPYAVGFVDLPEGVRVFADLSGKFEQFRIDMPVELAVDDEGAWTFTLQTKNGEVA
jgi:uncharacterized OB-fold protein